MNTLLTLLLILLSSTCFASTKVTLLNDQEQKAIFNAVNAYRIAHGLQKLTINQKISAIAQEHSRDMASHSIPFGHEGFHQRARLLAHQFSEEAVSENVAYTYKAATTVTPMWLNSSGHRHNIEGDYNLTGIGIAHDEHGIVYVTQIFIRTEA